MFTSTFPTFLFQQFESNWEKPGNIEIHGQKRFISSHPGEDRDSDSDDEDSKKQFPTPIQEEPITERDSASVITGNIQETDAQIVEKDQPTDEHEDSQSVIADNKQERNAQIVEEVEPADEQDDVQNVIAENIRDAEIVEEVEPTDEHMESSDNCSKDNMVDTGEAENDE